jgi:hypothetical protein
VEGRSVGWSLIDPVEPNFVEEKENGANSCHFAKATCLLGRTKSVSCVLPEIEGGYLWSDFVKILYVVETMRASY